MYFSEKPAAFATLAELEQKGKVLAFRQELQTKKGALTWAYRRSDRFRGAGAGPSGVIHRQDTAPAQHPISPRPTLWHCPPQLV